MWTRHGHHIPGTILSSSKNRPPFGSCGSISFCKECALDAARATIFMSEDLTDEQRLRYENTPEVLESTPIYDRVLAEHTRVAARLASARVPGFTPFEIKFDGTVLNLEALAATYVGFPHTSPELRKMAQDYLDDIR